jgi:hypothetical protein
LEIFGGKCCEFASLQNLIEHWNRPDFAFSHQSIFIVYDLRLPFCQSRLFIFVNMQLTTWRDEAQPERVEELNADALTVFRGHQGLGLTGSIDSNQRKLPESKEGQTTMPLSQNGLRYRCRPINISGEFAAFPSKRPRYRFGIDGERLEI